VVTMCVSTKMVFSSMILLGSALPQLTLSAVLAAQSTKKPCSSMPDTFVFLEDIDPTILQEIRYYTSHNFMGRRVEGYNSPSCVLTKGAAESLKSVQSNAIQLGYTLKVYDCYRPQQAVDEFVSWSYNTMDILMKEEFYPTLEKPDLFPDYIATKSGHSRGSTLDLTLVPLPIPSQDVYSPGQPLVNCYASVEDRFHDNTIDMGTGFDCLSPYANTDTDLVGYAHSSLVLSLTSSLLFPSQ
jgi:zinc D-Ala-D-Ala dipeptidase